MGPTKTAVISELQLPFQTNEVKVYLSADGDDKTDVWGWMSEQSVVAITGQTRNKVRRIFDEYKEKHPTLTRLEARNITYFIELGLFCRLMKSKFPLDKKIWSSKECITDALESLIAAIEDSSPEFDLCMSPPPSLMENNNNCLKIQLREKTSKYIKDCITRADMEIAAYTTKYDEYINDNIRDRVAEHKQKLKRKRKERNKELDNDLKSNAFLIKVAKMIQNTRY